MGIHIQKIQTNWTKESRSSPGSTLRNRVPEILPIETDELSDTIVLQEIIYSEGRFNEPSKKKVSNINEVQIREQRLEFNYSDDSLEIRFWTENGIRKKIGILSFNSWCQIKTNRRFPMEYTWGYYKIVYNIFYGDLNKAKDFMETMNKEIEMDFQTILI